MQYFTLKDCAFGLRVIVLVIIVIAVEVIVVVAMIIIGTARSAAAWLALRLQRALVDHSPNEAKHEERNDEIVQVQVGWPLASRTVQFAFPIKGRRQPSLHFSVRLPQNP